MKVDLKPFFDSGLERVLEFSFDGDTDVIPGRVDAKCLLRGVSGSVRVDASAKYRLVTRCDRCLEPIDRAQTIDVSHYLTFDDSESFDDEYVQIDDYDFDLSEFLREDIVMSLPSVTLCRPDCRGLCPECGKNLNEGECGCRKPADPRWAGLDEI